MRTKLLASDSEPSNVRSSTNGSKPTRAARMAGVEEFERAGCREDEKKSKWMSSKIEAANSGLARLFADTSRSI